ncbi:cupin domain-containing protein [Actinoplanes sp. RD1]|uniref:cupin n=1 Tax=Actinoplanes sp. RD1 TaxID=3064538 RepID=UPI0027407214|nr:cupin [Actinoplanes sp. RD1]
MSEQSAVVLEAGAGARIGTGGMHVVAKATSDDGVFASSFELVVPPGFDIGAHRIADAVITLYVRSGTLDVFAFQPVDTSDPDWRRWRSADDRRFLRGGPGTFVSVPPATPYAFANPGDGDTTLLFQSTLPVGHEKYFQDLADLMVAAGGKPAPATTAELRRRYGISQLSPLDPGRPAGPGAA